MNHCQASTYLTDFLIGAKIVSNNYQLRANPVPNAEGGNTVFLGDPIETVVFLYDTTKDKESFPKTDTAILEMNHTALENLTKILDQAANKKPNYINPDVYLRVWGMDVLYPKDTELAKSLYSRIITAGGSGVTDMQQSILQALLLQGAVAHIPFWKEMIDLKVPRDRFRKERKRIALAALLLMVLLHQVDEAYQTLLDLTEHDDAEVAAVAMLCMSIIHQEYHTDYPVPVLEQLQNSAVNGKTFAERFQARMALLANDVPIPIDVPYGAYEFRVSFWREKKTQRYWTIALRSNQTLQDLHNAIQDVLAWDNDHLFVFYMNGSDDDAGTDYEFASGFTEAANIAEDGILGELGLLPKHTFMYIFDFGDYHMFRIEVMKIHEKAKPGNYPMVLDSKGELPIQYPYVEDEEDEDGDEWMI